MEVSHFELIWKPQSPAAPTGTTAVANLIQGYFLEITNLEAVPYVYRLELVASPSAAPLRSLAGNAIVFVDTPDTNNQQGIVTGAIGDTTFFLSTGQISIPPNGTALVAILPSAFGPLPGDPTPLAAPNFEVRGHIRLALPPVFRRVGNFLFYGPQSNAPVKVLLTPQNRTTYFSAAGAVTGQTQASLPLASGNALNLIDPEQGFVLGSLDKIDRIPLAKLAQIEPPTPALLAGMLAMIDPEADLAAFNTALQEAGVRVALKPGPKAK